MPLPEQELFFLYLAGTFNPVRNSDARGTLVGISLSTKREHIARAVMEGVEFEVRTTWFTWRSTVI